MVPFRRPTLRPPVALALALGLLAASSACIKAPTQSPTMRKAENLADITSVQLRQQVYDFANEFAAVVEQAADDIAAGTGDAAVRDRALRWKMYAIPEAHRSAFNTDPFVGLIDTAVLCSQMRDFFAVGDGRDLFGPQQEIAVSAAKDLDDSIWELGRRLTREGDPTRARQLVDDYAARNPLTSLTFQRASVDPLIERVQAGRQQKAGEVLGTLNETVDDLSRRLTIYAEHLPRQARWEAELAIGQIQRTLPLEESLAALESFSASHELFAESVAAALVLVREERAAALTEVDRITLSSLDAVDRQRLETLAALQAERQELIRALEAQTALVLERVQQERVETLARADEILAASVAASFDRLDGLADRLFLRALVLVAVLAAALLLGALLVTRTLRPARPVADR